MNKKIIAAFAFAFTGTVSAQSAFQGFYGEISTGYENNTVNNTDITVSQSRVSAAFPARTFTDSNGGNASKGNMPLVLGLGYTFSLAPKFTLGLGADYSTLTTTTNTIQYTTAGQPTRLNKSNYKISNRYSIFLAPGYAIDKDKLAYFKAGYSNQKLEGFDGTSGNAEGSSNMSGYVLGLGYKQMITSGFYGFAEGNYYNYSKVNLNGSGSTTGLRAGGTFTQTSNPGANAYNFLVGVGYKF
jgi:outer membrane immunogenic protein